MVTCLAGTPSALAGFGEASHRAGKPHMARNSQQGVLPTDGLMVLEADPSPSSLQIKPSPGFQLDCRPLGDEARDPGKPCTGAQCVETCGTHRFFSYQGSGGLLHSCGWLTHTQRHTASPCRFAKRPDFCSRPHVQQLICLLCLRSFLSWGVTGGACGC